MALVQEIVFCFGVFQAQTAVDSAGFILVPLETKRDNGSFELLRTSLKLSDGFTVRAIKLIKLARLDGVCVALLTAFFEKSGNPVVLGMIILDCRAYAVRNTDMELGIDEPACAFDHPFQDRAAAMLIEIIRIVLDVAVAGDGGIERNDCQTPPCASLSTLTGKIRGFGTQLRKKCQKKLRCVFCNSTVERLRSKPTNVI